jgi:hypothetical protein
MSLKTIHKFNGFIQYIPEKDGVARGGIEPEPRMPDQKKMPRIKQGINAG